MATREGPLAGLVGLGDSTGHGRHHRARHARASAPGFGRAGRSLTATAVVLLLLAGAVFVVVQALRGTPAATVSATRSEYQVAGHLTALPWPATGGAALAVGGAGMVGTSGTTSPQPIASITKVMTALVVLQDHPLGYGETGPTITVTPADVTQYQADVATQQSVVAVTAGEHLTERQALEALLVPSGNNIADLLATWDAGSVSAFVARMNQRAAALGLHHTHFVSPSGLNPGSVSTPADLVRLGEAAMAQPVLAQIVRMPSVTLPVAGTVYNYDYEVGHDGFVGIKTGSDSAAGGCFLFDAKELVGTTEVSTFGAVLGQQTPPIIQSALDASAALVGALRPELRSGDVVTSGERVATLTTPWGATAPVVTARAVGAITWPGMTVSGTVVLRSIGSSVARGAHLGHLVLHLGTTTTTVPLVAGSSLAGPGLGWKITNV